MCMPNLKYLGYIINSWVASQEAGGVADQAGRRNMDPNMYLFAPIVVETIMLYHSFMDRVLNNMTSLDTKLKTL